VNSGQHDAPVALSQEETTVPTEQDDGWAPHVWTFQRSKNLLPLPNSNPVLSSPWASHDTDWAVPDLTSLTKKLAAD
jgi:hypothetical protein